MERMVRLFSVSVFVLFFISIITAQTNMLPNGDLETVAPGFWNELNEGDGSSVLSWDLENGYEGSRCIKVEKPNASSDQVGWKSVDNAYLYWNHAMAERVYNVHFRAKSQGVNTNPASDDDKIGVLFEFYAGGNLLGGQFIAMDQSAASTGWTEYTGEGLLIPAGPNPDEMYVTAYMGKNATGTVWFDDIDCGSDPWEMGLFNGNFEAPMGWMEWHDGKQGFSNTVQGDAHGGDWSVLLHEWDNNSDEMVFYSAPVAAEPNKWYKISVWAKWDSVNIDDYFLPSNVTTEFAEERLGMCFFFHKAPLEKSWDLTGGDQFFYFEQRAAESDWVQYSVIARSPEDAAGVSCRARFNPYPVGKVWYDDFTIEELKVAPNILVNGDLETVAPGFWNELNEGDGSSVLSWDLENGYEGSRCIKVEKPNASSDQVGWKSVDNAYLYWNHAMAERVYTVHFRAKSQGVNTNPASDDEKIGVLFEFYAGGNLLGGQFIAMDQSAAGTEWTEYTGEGLLIPAGPNPDEMYATAYMGKNATGTVWFDDIDCGSDPWEMGLFNGNFETPTGWMEWHDGKQGFSNTVQGDAHSGDWSTLLHEWDNNSDEMVFYSAPVAAEPNKWYKISVWAKWDSVNIDDYFLPSNVTTEFAEERLGMCFFFHKAPLEKSWDLTGGDQFFYFEQRAAESDWVHYSVIARSPEDAAGVSCRARFNPYPVGKVWYDDFTIEPVEVVLTGIEEFAKFRIEMPQDFVISQNYPNPFNPETTIHYSVPKDGHIQIDIFDMLGRKVRTLFDGFRVAGNHSIHWDARDESGQVLASGIYFVALKHGDFVTAKSITLLK